MGNGSLDSKLDRLEISAESVTAVEIESEPRRELLEKLGRFSYIAPAMLLLTDPANAKDDYKDKPPKDKPPKV